MKPNYQYVLEQCEELTTNDAKILDYGCGKGDIVIEGRKRGFDFFGVEAFAHGSGINIKEQINDQDLLGDVIKEIDLDDNVISFPDNYFDLIVSNQVFEHVVDMDKVLVEISRVLKDDGKIALIFPSKEVFREGHCGILFPHWMPKSRFRYYWLLINRSLGFGRLNSGRTKKQWANFFNNWLAESVTYRSLKDIDSIISRYFYELDHIEEGYLHFRLNRINYKNLAMLSTVYPFSLLSRLFVRKWGGLVIVASNKS
ncbi:MAG: class I SAM-dependent methyltransferase [Bacteroidetes bacterium]|nr:class I SAM-dependent methyltransferase [Bacteroidota bacterium]